MESALKGTGGTHVTEVMDMIGETLIERNGYVICIGEARGGMPEVAVAISDEIIGVQYRFEKKGFLRLTEKLFREMKRRGIEWRF